MCVEGRSLWLLWICVFMMQYSHWNGLLVILIWCLIGLSTWTKSQWSNFTSCDGFSVFIMEITDTYWGLSFSKNDYFVFLVSLLGAMSSALKVCVDLAKSILVLAAWCLRSCRRSCERDFLLQGVAEGWWKWRRSGCPSLAFSCMLRLSASQNISSFAASPCWQYHASSQRLARATSSTLMTCYT